MVEIKTRGGLKNIDVPDIKGTTDLINSVGGPDLIKATIVGRDGHGQKTEIGVNPQTGNIRIDFEMPGLEHKDLIEKLQKMGIKPAADITTKTQIELPDTRSKYESHTGYIEITPGDFKGKLAPTIKASDAYRDYSVMNRVLNPGAEAPEDRAKHREPGSDNKKDKAECDQYKRLHIDTSKIPRCNM